MCTYCQIALFDVLSLLTQTTMSYPEIFQMILYGECYYQGQLCSDVWSSRGFRNLCDDLQAFLRPDSSPRFTSLSWTAWLNMFSCGHSFIFIWSRAIGQDYEVSFQKIFCFHNLDFQETLPSDTARVMPSTSSLTSMVVTYLTYIDMMIQVQRGSLWHMSHCHSFLILGPGLQRPWAWTFCQKYYVPALLCKFC